MVLWIGGHQSGHANGHLYECILALRHWPEWPKFKQVKLSSVRLPHAVYADAQKGKCANMRKANYDGKGLANKLPPT
jgi:hypothetical protein